MSSSGPSLSGKIKTKSQGLRLMPKDVAHSILLMHDEPDYLHGVELSSRELALMMLKSLDENGEDTTFARNKLKQIDSAWIDYLNAHNQRECEEFKTYKGQLERAHGLLRSEINQMLISKQLKIATMNVKKLKLFMNKYKDDPDLVEKIRHKLGLIISEYYSRDEWFKFYNGAHPEYIMNSFIYNPRKDETRFKILRIDGNQVTYQPYHNNEPVGEPIKIGLNEFLEIRISDQPIPIGEVYSFFPARNPGFDTDASYNKKVNDYLGRLMESFANKPATEFSSVPNGGRRTHHKRHDKKNKRTNRKKHSIRRRK